ncbi:hypothetical protein [Aestuariivirga sp.]|uniref:hypothetical protein n=1 Tax=Aestuariivirga sp. TaxID=2650926 RepID=UPI00391DFD80
MARKSSSQKTPKLSELIPERIAGLLGEQPVLPFESADEFEALHAGLVVAYAPKDMVEHFWVRDLAEIRWEIMRLRAMRRAAIENKLPAATAQLAAAQLQRAWGEEPNPLYDSEHIADDFLRKIAHGSENSRKRYNSILKRAGVTHDRLKVVAYTKDLKTISALDGAICLEQHRFDQIVRNLENRRQTNTTMTRGLGLALGDVVDVPSSEADQEASS